MDSILDHKLVYRRMFFPVIHTHYFTYTIFSENVIKKTPGFYTILHSHGKTSTFYPPSETNLHLG